MIFAAFVAVQAWLHWLSGQRKPARVHVVAVQVLAIGGVIALAFFLALYRPGAA